ncbi:hypothetical protein DFH11DRAFT_768622 [Phellopilus nigrolimitatus]|nr:hypothetical protein DFH11DRAFT_768622 [Phellopilus nigrolimitatus]
MSLKPCAPGSNVAANHPRPIRIIASGTVFLTHVLTLPTFPGEATVARARTVTRERGGNVANVLAALGQFAGVDAMLVAPLAGNGEGAMLVRDLQREHVNTRFCKVWDGASVPSAWVIESEDSGSRTVINHNPLPDITHEEFVSLLGPLLIPENYEFANTAGNASVSASSSSNGRPQSAGNALNSPAPFEWLHFEGRSVKTTLSNIIGIDGLARERKWRSHCVFSLDACKIRQGVEALIPHADVIFFSKQYALSQNAAYTTPRPFLLALASSGRVPAHALLIAYWGTAGAALLSVPTREYLQSSGWVDDEPPRATRPLSTVSEGLSGSVSSGPDPRAVGSVRSGSGFWAAGHRAGSGTSSSAYTAFSGAQASSPRDSYGYGGYGYGDPGLGGGIGGIPEGRALEPGADAEGAAEDVDHDSQGTEIGEKGNGAGTGSAKGKERARRAKKDVCDEAAAQDAFIAGMIYSLGQRILPGAPYTPSAAPYAQIYGSGNLDIDKGRWKLEDCLRFASELAGRRARKRDFTGLADEMQRTGWFD